MSQILTTSRIEYVGTGINWYRGCSHDCLYCYMGDKAGLAARFDHLRPAEGWARPEPRIADPVAALRAALQNGRPAGPIMLSTSHDPAFDEEVARQMCQLVEILAEHELLGETLLLTKAPTRALQALAGAGAEEGLRFGASITTLGIGQTRKYEPDAEMPADRLTALAEAARQGYRLWISLEPPLPHVYLSHLVRALLDSLSPAWPWLVLGKLNFDRQELDEELYRWSRSDHWPGDRDEAVALLQEYGYRESLAPQDRGFWVKKELRA
jgi:DNA repair photolyase